MQDTTAVSQVAVHITQTLDALAERFGATGAMLWEALVEYEFAHAVGVIGLSTAIGALGFILLLVGLIRGEKSSNNCEGHGPRVHRCSCGEGWYILATVSGIAFGIILIVTLLAGPSTIATILSPEAAVIKSLMP